MSVEALVSRPELMALCGHTEYMEKRRLFLQSYHFSRKPKPGAFLARARRSLVRGVRRLRLRLVWAPLRAARRIPRLFWVKLRSPWSGRFHRLVAAAQPHHRPSSSSDWSW